MLLGHGMFQVLFGFLCTVAESNAGNLMGTVDLNHRRCCVLIPVKSEILASRVKKYFGN